MNLEQRITELESIIREMRAIADGIGRDFRGIGQDRCADCIRVIARHYERNVLNLLRTMRMNRWEERRHN